jgi:putative membrane protein
MAALFAWLADCAEGMSRWGTGGWIWMGLMMLAGLVLVVAVVYLLLKGPQSSGAAIAAPGPKETPLEIAQRRYAAGEITQEEFGRIKQDLSG